MFQQAAEQMGGKPATIFHGKSIASDLNLRALRHEDRGRGHHINGSRVEVRAETIVIRIVRILVKTLMNFPGRSHQGKHEDLDESNPDQGGK